MKKYVQTVTDRPLSVLKSPFHRNPGEGFGTDITLDQIYTNLNIHEVRADSKHLAGDRDTLLENYPPKIANFRPRPADIFDAEKQYILLVGHPGTGKTMFCTEYSAALSDENDVWDYIRQNPNKVLVIFDGFDECSGRTKIDNDDILYRNPREEDRMPLHSLLK